MTQNAPNTAPANPSAATQTPAQTTWTADRVRQTYLDFFCNKPAAPTAPSATHRPDTPGHTSWPSSPCVPYEDPTLLFTNAGMNQFKPIFLGSADPATDLGKLKRAVNTQKCIRAGGKHNDLEDVGRDTYHHTFFEMLGNWSFGDYFKQQAIDWAWELLTKVYHIPPDRLYATYFGGDEKAGLLADNEARDLWLRHLPQDHVLPGNMKDNFWEMGDTGPCGPCSEIHYDRIGNRNAAHLVNNDDPDVLEIWNLVFIQFNRANAHTLHQLPAKHVDTGMGLERLVSVLQNKRSNYDTDVFTPIFDAIQRATGARPYTPGGDKAALQDPINVAYRVIADHLRTLTFAITDGATPSNEGRGYVLRRVLRRAVRFGRQNLSAKTGFFADLVPILVQQMGDAFPELRKDPARVQGIIRDEEESFSRTLDRGIQRYQLDLLLQFGRHGEDQNKWKYVSSGWSSSPAEPAEQIGLSERPIGMIQVRTDSGATTEIPVLQDIAEMCRKYGLPPMVFSGKYAFDLYDTYGFPLDLTQIMASENRITVDTPGFEAAMEAQKERSRQSSQFAGAGTDNPRDAAARTLPPEAIGQLEKLKVNTTNDTAKFDRLAITARITAIWDGSTWDQSQHAGTGHLVGVILNRTCFYAEMGGQVGDSGHLTVSHETKSNEHDLHRGGEATIIDTRAFGGYVLHVARITSGELRVGDDVIIRVDHDRRRNIQANHTATHLLNLALRQTLQTDADQRGSLVAPDKLRFDFDAPKPVTPEQIAQTDRILADAITADLVVSAQTVPLTEARKIAGLRAVFGEAYPDPVRVVAIGATVNAIMDDPTNTQWCARSIEFCGGTHLNRTSEITDFTILQEEGIAKGVRRITAVTGIAAKAARAAAMALLEQVSSAKNLTGKPLAAAITDITKEFESLDLPAASKPALRAAIDTLVEKAKAEQKQQAATAAKLASEHARTIGQRARDQQLTFIAERLDTAGDRKALQAAASTIQSISPTTAVLLISLDEGEPTDAEGKLSILAVVPDQLVAKGMNAGTLVNAASSACGGKGGGKPQQAQGGGTIPAKLNEAIQAAKSAAITN